MTSAPKHPLLYDYYGFPAYTYKLGYDCPGEPALANRVIDMLQTSGFNARGDETRGYDHGVFIPLKLMYPEADIPVVQVKIVTCHDPLLCRAWAGQDTKGHFLCKNRLCFRSREVVDFQTDLLRHLWRTKLPYFALIWGDGKGKPKSHVYGPVSTHASQYISALR